MGKLERRCLSSWRRYLPNFEFKLWDEKSLPTEVMSHPYVATMYRKKKWAFVADYVRFWALYREGGIYLDTDTEVLRNFDPLLEHDVFFGRAKDGFVAAGVIGSIPGQKVIKDILHVYDQDREFDTDRTSPRTITDVLSREHYDNVTVYDHRYFNPCDDGEKRSRKKLSLAYTDNLWAESWVSFARLRKLLRRIGVMGLIKRLYVAKAE